MTPIPLPPAFQTLPIAHRALHSRAEGVIENSPAAIRAAIAAGYAIEIDLQLSQDGEAMVFHDEELDRLTFERGPVSQRSAAELQQIRLRDSDDCIPTLAGVLDLVAGQVPLLIELKDQTLSLSQSDGRLEARTAELLKGYEGDVAVMSFNPSMVAAMAQFAPQIARGLTTSAYEEEDWAPLAPATCARLRDIPDYEATGASFVSHEAADLGRERLAALKAGGAKILCWTIRSAAEEAKAREIADNITFEAYRAALPR